MSGSSSSSSAIGRKRQHSARNLGSDSQSQDDSPVVVLRRKTRTRVVSPTESSESESEVEVRRPRIPNSAAKPVLISDTDDESDSPDLDSICPICLGKLFETTLRGRPNSCSHSFCLECITTWSKNNSTCVLCRAPFTAIKVMLRDDVLDELSVEEVSLQLDDIPLDYSPTICKVCQNSDQEDSLLLCYQCEDAYHCACLDMPVSGTLPEQWLCPQCQPETPDDNSDDSYVPDEEYATHSSRRRMVERIRRSRGSSRDTNVSRRRVVLTRSRQRTG